MIVLDPASSLPPFEQLRTQIVDDIAAGHLVAGTRLPTVRRLAEDLGIAPGTVARAYRELETAGFVETRGRHGTFVSAQGDPALRQAQQAAREFAAQMHVLHIDPEQALALAAAALQGLR
ncbi:GntR family transcriptional regulator [Microbacterium dextranolyticum]|uniref:GntR family transcriptional regulator n=1 Tax=Microbacterium dextranolyticum TaxID=36806 RepID=A0A9W6HNZ2_9MICO|nr:GntR family transcriptional regulator [Microbacterium dextranolyticum]MBM7462645.1 DNA-binding transcriptional regulator YhcF (GntR family) [Microbacterium dextranolyticum]GLJ96251.1 GntR family transcriptional regulator [Microbacterium dextranolyticum]